MYFRAIAACSSKGGSASAIHATLVKIKENQSPAPFILLDPVYNEDLLLALSAVSELEEETPIRVFSERVYNESKRFED